MTFAKRLRELRKERMGNGIIDSVELILDNAEAIAELAEAVEAFTTTGTNYTRVIEALMELNKGAK